MKAIKYIGGALIATAMTAGMSSCTDLDEVSYDRIDASVYYQDENSVKGAVASIYASGTAGIFLVSERILRRSGGMAHMERRRMGI